MVFQGCYNGVYRVVKGCYKSAIHKEISLARNARQTKYCVQQGKVCCSEGISSLSAAFPRLKVM